MDNLPQTNANPPTRITWGSIWSDFLNVINFEKGVFFTIKGLFLNPKATIDDYLYGNRNMHASPLRFLIFSTAIITLLNFYLVLQPTLENVPFKDSLIETNFNSGKEIGESISIAFTDEELNNIEESNVEKEISKKKLTPEERQIVFQESMKFLFSWMDKFTFASIPIFSLFTFLFFRKIGYNYTENLVINAFQISVINVLGIVFSLPSYFSPIYAGIVLSVVVTSYTFYFMYHVFEVDSFGGFMKMIASVIITYLFYLLIMLAVVVNMMFNAEPNLGL